MHIVKHAVLVRALAIGGILVSSACTPTQPEAPEATATDRCSVVSRAVRSELVRLAPDGSIARRPILRPSCAAVSRDAVAWVDDAGLHVDVLDETGALVRRLDRPGAPPEGCLADVRALQEGVLLLEGPRARLLQRQGEQLLRLPPLRPGERIVSWRDGLFFVGTHARVDRIVDADGVRRQPSFVGRGPRDDGHDVTALVGADEDVLFALQWGQARVVQRRCGRDVSVGGTPIPVTDDVQVWLAHDRLLVADADDVVEHRPGTPPVRRLALPADRSVAGEAFDNVTLVRRDIAWAQDVDLFVIDERIRAPDCTIADRISVAHPDGRVIELPLRAAPRSHLRVDDDGTIWFVESELVYEPLRDASGTSVP